MLKLSELADHIGNIVVTKSVGFKVEVLRAASPSRYACGANLTLVKGAQSSFKGESHIYASANTTHLPSTNLLPPCSFLIPQRFANDCVVISTSIQLTVGTAH